MNTSNRFKKWLDRASVVIIILIVAGTAYVIYSGIQLSNSLSELEQSLDELESRAKNMKSLADDLESEVKKAHE